MKRQVAVFAALGIMLLSTSLPALAQSLPVEGWGKSVDGVQLHLSKLNPQLSPTLYGLLPGLEVQVRNRGAETLAIDTCGISEIEIDGVRYVPVGIALTGSCPVLDLYPGSQSGDISVRSGWVNASGFGLVGKPRPWPSEAPRLNPGRHYVRVIASFTLHDPLKLDSAITTITVVSNAVSIEVVK